MSDELFRQLHARRCRGKGRWKRVTLRDPLERLIDDTTAGGCVLRSYPANRDLRATAQPARHSGDAHDKAVNTSSTCPSTFTFGKMRSIVPSRSMRNVVRSMPMYVRPYIDFSFQTP